MAMVAMATPGNGKKLHHNHTHMPRYQKTTHLIWIFSLSALIGTTHPSTTSAQEMPSDPLSNEDFLQMIEEGLDMENLEKEDSLRLKQFLQNRQQALNDNTSPCSQVGRVALDLHPINNTALSSGESAFFRGSLRHTFDTPIADGVLIAKIFRSSSDSISATTDAVQVEEILISEQLFLSPDMPEIPAGFQWEIPKDMPSGEYEARFFFLTGNGITPQGIRTSPTANAGTLSFSIESSVSDMPILLDRSSATVNGRTYVFEDPFFEVSDNETARLAITVKNSSNTTKPVFASWDIQYPGNTKESFETSEEILLPSNATEQISQQLEVRDLPAEITVRASSSAGASSLAEFRLVQTSSPRIIAHSLSSETYPIKSGENTRIFACLDDKANTETAPTVTLSVIDASGNILHSSTREQSLSEGKAFLESSFVPNRDIGTFSVEARIAYDSSETTIFSTKYDCSSIESVNCDTFSEPSNKEEGALGLQPLETFSRIASIILGSIALALLGILLFFFVQKRRKPPVRPLIVTAFLLSSALLSTSNVQAKVVVSEFALPDLQEWPGSGEIILSDYEASVSYNVVLQKENGEEVEEDENIAIGEELVLSFESERSNIVLSNGERSVYGLWKENGNPPSDGSYPAYRLESGKYVALSIHPRDMDISSTGNISCSQATGICTVTGTGDISVSAEFDWTTGFIYAFNTDDEEWRFLSSGVDPYGPYLPEKQVVYSFEGSSSGPPSEPDLLEDETVFGEPGDYDADPWLEIPVTFSFVSDDADSADIYYYLSWSYRGWGGPYPKQNLRAPSSGYVSPGDPQSVTHYFPPYGNHKVHLQACDMNGSCSPWKEASFITNESARLTAPQCSYTTPENGNQVISLAPGGATLDELAENSFVLAFNKNERRAITEIPATLNTPLEPGRYTIHTHTWDGYESRVDVDQPEEKMSVAFNAGGREGDRVMETGYTTDLEDYVEYAEQRDPTEITKDQFSDILLQEGTADTLLFRHKYADCIWENPGDCGNADANSLVPICAAIEKEPECLVICEQGVERAYASSCDEDLSGGASEAFTLNTTKQLRALLISSNEDPHCDDDRARNITNNASWDLENGDASGPVTLENSDDSKFRDYLGAENGKEVLTITDSDGKEASVRFRVGDYDPNEGTLPEPNPLNPKEWRETSP